MTERSETIDRLLLTPDTRVTCPKCDAEFSLQAGFAKRALEKFEQSTRGALETLREQEREQATQRAQGIAADHAKALQAQNKELKQLVDKQSAEHAKALKEVRGVAEKSLEPRLAALKIALAESQGKLQALAGRESALVAKERDIEIQIEKEAQTRAQKLLSSQQQALQLELANKNEQIASLRSVEIDLRKEKSAIEERAAGLELEVIRKLDEGRAEIERKARAQERERADLEKAELQKRLNDTHEQLLEAQRKASQGSQQLQGEVLEVTLEARLIQAFPLDGIEEVKKGVRGGDVIHRVATRSAQIAGVVLWEAKRAKDWSAQWPSKLKDDMRACGAAVGILVISGTATPKEWEDGQLFGLHEDVWVTCWSAALQLAEVIRVGLLDVHKQRLVSAGKGEKMEALYDYLTSPQFAQKLKAIYGAFQRMRQELESEKTSTQQRWARREKQLQIGVAELTGVAGDIQGLAQQEVALLELEVAGDREPDAVVQSADASQVDLAIDRNIPSGENR